MEEAGDEEVCDVGAGAEGARVPDGECSPVFGGVLRGPGPLEEVVRSWGDARPDPAVVLSANLQDVEPDRLVTVLLLSAGLTGPCG